MTHEQLKKGEEIASKIKKAQSVIDVLTDEKGELKCTEQKASELLVEFITRYNNIEGSVLRPKLALIALEAIVKHERDQVKILEDAFDSL